jgi:large subunit ribosomal protein L3
MNFLVGKKVNMSQFFDEASGTVFPVTVVQFLPGVVTQVKNAEKDKYSAIQVGVLKGKEVNKPSLGHLKELGNYKMLTEFRVKESKDFQRGQKLDLEGLKVGDIVNVVGISKGRGFAGAMKRHGFKGFPMSHGHNKPRSVGSIGQRFPQHVRKGLRMAGHMGNQQVTVKNLQIVEIDGKKNLLSLKGAIPGHRNAIIKVISTGKSKPLVKVAEVKEEKKKK